MIGLNQKGIVLVTVYFIIVILLIFLLPMLTRSISEYRITERDKNYTQALYIAEAGLEEGVRQLKLDSSYNPSATYTSFGNGGYTIRVTGSGLPSDKRKVISVGEVPDSNSSSYGYQKVTLESCVNIQEKPLFANAVFSLIDINLQSSVAVDSYDSSLGAYGESNVGSEGNIVTNGITTGAITVSDARVSGSATIGSGGDAETGIDVKGSGDISGSRVAASENTELPALPTPPESVTDKIKLTGETIQTLDPGTYWYTSIVISDTAQLVLRGPVTLNSLGDVTIGGSGIATHNNLPANLRINVVNAGSAKVEYTNRTSRDFYGSIYSPNNDVRLTGTGEIFGAVIGKTIFATDSVQIHYDTALKNAGGGVGFNINDISWRQQ